MPGTHQILKNCQSPVTSHAILMTSMQSEQFSPFHKAGNKLSRMVSLLISSLERTHTRVIRGRRRLLEKSYSDCEHWGQARGGHPLCTVNCRQFLLFNSITYREQPQLETQSFPSSFQELRGKWKTTFPKNLHERLSIRDRRCLTETDDC